MNKITSRPDRSDVDTLEDMGFGEVRERLLRFIDKRDMDRHREIYGELSAE